jgi:membrane-bound lytic murein transglycosylase A
MSARWPLRVLGADERAAQGELVLRRVEFGAVPAFAADDLQVAFQTFLRSARFMTARNTELRAALPTPDSLKRVCDKAISADVRTQDTARSFFETHFDLCAFEDHGSQQPPFFTGYYEPVVQGSLTQSADFTEPVFARPQDLESISPYPSRAEIDAAGAARFTPLLWLRDAIEVFMIQVQGSAAVDLPDGKRVRLTYAGRNGAPYTSIGRILIEEGEIAPADMSLARLKQWVRDHGQKQGERGRALLHRNKSYVFFTLDDTADRAIGPIGGAGVPLTPLRSVAMDRSLWPYGLPVFVDGQIPDAQGELAPFARLMIGQDTGSAIVGPGRLDLFIGSGDEAGARAGNIRHGGGLYILLPKSDS